MARRRVVAHAAALPFVVEGEIRAWDPLRRVLQIADMVLILAHDVPVNGLAVVLHCDYGRRAGRGATRLLPLTPHPPPC